MKDKPYLFSPGPTPVPPEVLAANAEPMVHHRGPDFREIYERTLARLRDVHRSASPVLLFSASGTGAMDSAVTNLCRPGDRVAVVVAGAFGERWAKMCGHYGLDVVRVDYAWGERPNPAEVAAAAREGGAGVVFATQSETSTGVVTDVQTLKAALGEVVLVVDGVSSVGAVPLETDAWGIDVVVSGSQKALMCPPGLATACVAEELWERLPNPSGSFYFDWRATRRAQEVFDASFTPAVSLIRGLDVALAMILADGLESSWDRHTRLGRATRAGVKAMGLELFSPDDDSSAVVTAIRAPEGIEAPALLRHLRERHGVTLAPGQGALKPSLFRIGHIGWLGIYDIVVALAAVEIALGELGAELERGVATAAALEAFEQPLTAA